MTNFFFFGPSGIGKTTLIESLFADHRDRFYIPKVTVTRSLRKDDNPRSITYITVDVFQRCRSQNKFYYDADDGRKYYGYKTIQLQPTKLGLFYGFPSVINKIKEFPSYCILILGEATIGLSMRKESFEEQKRKNESNQLMREKFYDNLQFQQKMDLILTNRFEGVAALKLVFYRFLKLKMHEKLALGGNLYSLKFVTAVYAYSHEGLLFDRVRFSFWFGKALENPFLSFLFYNNILHNFRINTSKKILKNTYESRMHRNIHICENNSRRIHYGLNQTKSET